MLMSEMVYSFCIVAAHGCLHATMMSQTQPGYHDAPGIDKPLAIVFVKVRHWCTTSLTPPLRSVMHVMSPQLPPA